MTDKDIENVAGLLKSISHPIRLKILCLIQDKEMTVGDLRDEIETSTPNVTQHLTKLRNIGIISSRKDERFVLNQISDDRILKLLTSMKSLFCP